MSFGKVYSYKFNAHLFLFSSKLPVLAFVRFSVALFLSWWVLLYSFILLMVFGSVACKEQGTGLTMTLTSRGLLFLLSKKPRGVRLLAFALWLSLLRTGISVRLLAFSSWSQNISAIFLSFLSESYSFPQICKEVYNGWNGDRNNQKTVDKEFWVNSPIVPATLVLIPPVACHLSRIFPFVIRILMKFRVSFSSQEFTCWR